MHRLSVLAAQAALCVLVSASPAFALNPPEGDWQWTAPYAAADPVGRFQTLTPGPAGSVYVAGDAWATQWVVSRVDTAAGAELWSRTTRGPQDLGASPQAAAGDRAGNLIVAGHAETGNDDIYVVKYKPSGDVQWQKSWAGPDNLSDRAWSVAVDRAGNALVAGEIGRPGGYSDAVLLKYDPAGRLKWKYVLATPLFDRFAQVACDGAGNAYVTGIRAGSMESAEMVTLKVNAYGRRVWMRTIRGLGVSYDGMHLRVKGDAVYVAGALYKNGMWPIVAKYTLAGRLVWERADGNSLQSVDDMAVDSKGRVVTVGSFRASLVASNVVTTAFVYVYAADGRSLWASAMYYMDLGPTTRYPARFNKVVLDSTDAMYCAGGWDTSGTGAEANAIVVRFAPLDVAGWNAEKVWRYDGPASGIDEFLGLLRVSDTEIVAAGTRITGGGAQGILDRLALP
jgi:hypothetical protein